MTAVESQEMATTLALLRAMNLGGHFDLQIKHVGVAFSQSQAWQIHLSFLDGPTRVTMDFATNRDGALQIMRELENAAMADRRATATVSDQNYEGAREHATQKAASEEGGNG